MITGRKKKQKKMQEVKNHSEYSSKLTCTGTPCIPQHATCILCRKRGVYYIVHGVYAFEVAERRPGDDFCLNS